MHQDQAKIAARLTRGGSPSLASARPALTVWLLLLLTAPLLAQDDWVPEEDSVPRRRARVTRVATPPVIDGVLEPEIWDLAEPIGSLVQVVPNEGAEPTERSDIRVLYDREHLYIGMRFYDSEPDKIIATTRERDAFLDADDRVEIVIDTYLDRRNAFFFQMNAAGSEGDALITGNGQDFNKPWDGIWEGRSRIDAEGWTAEMILPFKTLNFREGITTWGFNVERYIGRRIERARWNAANQDQRLFTISQAGNLEGIADIDQGVGLDLVPFFVGRWADDGAGDQDILGSPGFDAFYNLTPNLTLSLTYNTDFAETEVDQRLVNLTRFPLFFPERRDFFLQDAGVFEFGQGLGSNLVPFFSRRIGLSSNGEEVPLLGGAKITGRAGPWNIGALNIQTEDQGDLDAQNLFAARISRNIGAESNVGAIVTHGDPSGGDNSLIGVDYNFRNSRLGGGERTITANVFGLTTDSDSEEDSEGGNYAWGGGVSFPNDLWRWSLRFLEIQEGFDPALGFVRRRDIRRYTGSLSYRPRPGGDIRQLEFGLDGTVITDTEDDLKTSEFELQPFGIEWEGGDAMRIEIEQSHEEIEEDFEISDGIVVPVGDYDFLRARLEFESAVRRKFSVILNATGGEFFDGTRETYVAELAWQPGPLFRGSVGYELNTVDLDAGSFDTRVAFVDTSFTFSPDLAWNTILQWDNVSETFGVQSRLRYIPVPGREWTVVWNEARLNDDENDFEPLFQELAFKVTYTIRF